ncbi:hypothetical protein [Methanoregula sp.]|jgi:hypothetical protein|uniref:hypothetical protein n=1 Tax=Methanoregula sp. TaxID=2052170 RepID=UPI003C781106
MHKPILPLFLVSVVLVALFLYFSPYGIGTTPKIYNATISTGVMMAGATVDGVKTSTPSITLLDHGGNNIDLQYISVSINGINESDIRPEQGMTHVVVNAEGIYPVQDVNNNHVIAIGHFEDGETKVLVDTIV